MCVSAARRGMHRDAFVTDDARGATLQPSFWQTTSQLPQDLDTKSGARARFAPSATSAQAQAAGLQDGGRARFNRRHVSRARAATTASPRSINESHCNWCGQLGQRLQQQRQRRSSATHGSTHVLLWIGSALAAVLLREAVPAPCKARTVMAGHARRHRSVLERTHALHAAGTVDYVWHTTPLPCVAARLPAVYSFKDQRTRVCMWFKGPGIPALQLPHAASSGLLQLRPACRRPACSSDALPCP